MSGETIRASSPTESSLASYWPRPWSAEDGGPRRHGAAVGVPGLAVAPGERLSVVASRDAFVTDMLIRREPGELFALRHDPPVGGPQAKPVQTWVERLDPRTLEVIAESPRLPGGPYWPGGVGVDRDGDLLVVFGAWAHRLSPALEVLASHRLPGARPHNSFVLLSGGELVTKDCDAPVGREPSTVSVLDRRTLLPLCPPLALPEPSIARLSSDGESVIALGTTTAFRLRFDRDAARLEIDTSWRPRYGPAPGRGFGWDPVLTDEHVLWMDNGSNAVSHTMLGTGLDESPLRLWWVRRDDERSIRSVEISGLPRGTESNPPAFDPLGRVVVAYDSGNAMLRAWRLNGDALEPLWRLDGFAHAGHIVLYPDTRELLVTDWRGPGNPVNPLARAAARAIMQRLSRVGPLRRAAGRLRGGDQLVVLDLDSGAEKGRVAVPSPTQAFLFPAPGFERDFYYQSITTIARVTVT
ncbi:MAG TPA: hypothetical protein VN618_03365 [Solirubrobacteraceae bacterium]|nr:hypothetical protein [Solirubrobacteraceae bacterium]